jgi:tetratricopeptide (TPR) repeat protein
MIPLLLLLACASVPAAAESSVAGRAEELLQRVAGARDAEQRKSLRTALEAVADTLESGDEVAIAARVLDQAGLLAFRGGDVEGAKSDWSRGLDLARQSGDRRLEATLLNSRAIGVSAGGDLETGAALFEELVELRRELGDVRGEGVTLTNLARARLMLFRLPEADAALSRALECHREAGNLNGLAQSYQQRAQVLVELQEGEAALAMADSAVAVARRGANERTLGTLLADRGWIRHQGGDAEGGLGDLDAGIAILDAIGDPILGENPRLNRGLCLIDLARIDEAIAAIEEVEAARSARADERGVVVARSTRGFALVEAGRFEDARAVLEEAVADLERLRAELEEEESRVAAFRIGGQAYAHLARCLLEQGDMSGAWSVAERARASRLRARLGAGESTVALDSLQAELERVDAQLLHYGDASGSWRTVFTVRPDTLVAHVVEMPAGLGPDLELAGFLIGSGADDETVQPVLDRIASALVDPVVDALDPSRARLLVSLPKGLAGLPFEALPIADGASLIDRWLVSEVPSATVFVLLQHRGAADGPPLALADPVVEETDAEELVLAERYRSAARTPLPMARREGALVAGEAGRLVAGGAASREVLDLDGGPRPGVIHFATHAVVDPIQPDASALLLAGTGRGALLTASDVEGIELDADLIALSGCRTAKGLPVLGEGTLGLSRAFLLSGARSVVMTRWDVEDETAARFMEHFYAELRKGRPRDEALRSARSRLSEEGRPLRDRAAFVLVGASTDPVASLAGTVAGAGPNWPLLGLILAVVSAIGIALRRWSGSPNDRSA